MAIKTLEAFIGMSLLFGSLLAAYSFLPRSPQQLDTRAYGESILEALAYDQNFRNLVIAADSNDLSGIRAGVSQFFPNPFSVQVCDLNNNCYGPLPAGALYVTVNYLYEGNATNYSPKTVYLHMEVLK